MRGVANDPRGNVCIHVSHTRLCLTALKVSSPWGIHATTVPDAYSGQEDRKRGGAVLPAHRIRSTAEPSRAERPLVGQQHATMQYKATILGARCRQASTRPARPGQHGQHGHSTARRWAVQLNGMLIPPDKVATLRGFMSLMNPDSRTVKSTSRPARPDSAGPHRS